MHARNALPNLAGSVRRIVSMLLLLAAVATPTTALAQAGGSPPGGQPGGGPGAVASICTECEWEPDPDPVLPLDAGFGGQTLPTAMSVGYSYPVTVTMVNTGSETWQAGSIYRLGSQNPVNNMVWGTGRAELPTNVPAGASVTFAFQITPPTAGTYNFQWRMVKEGVAWFGETSTNVALAVGPYNPPPTVAMTAPASGTSSTAPVSLTLTASAADSGGSIASVRFYDNGKLLATDATAPFAHLYGDVPAGAHQFTAVATDNGGAYTTSAPVTHTVAAGSTATVSAVRRYVYDAHQRLCKTIEPESGATVYGYDAASNIVWTAEGLDLPSAMSCDQASVPENAKTVREYDAMNRMWKQTTPDGNGTVTKSFTPDGLDETLAVTNPGGATVTTTYRYNRRRLLEGETSANGSTMYSLGYAFNPNGHLHSLAYPDNQVVVYSPDGLGRTTEVRSAAGVTYARDISYHASGAISGFTYGNDVIHTLQQNRRQLPARSIDQKGITKILDDSMFFDENGNVSDIIDGAQAGKTSRGMGYDGLDRLTMVVSDKQWGVANYAYDALDNIRVNDLGARKFRYEYDGVSNRLSRILSPQGAQLHDFAYDSRGNTTRKNTQAYVFDRANRMGQVTGLQSYRYDTLGRRVQTTDADGKTTFWIYSQSGQVLYTSEARRSQNLSYIYLGNSQVATRAAAWGTGTVTVKYQHTDMLGSPVAETSSTGSILKRTSFSPYGEPWKSTTVDGTGYTGHVMDGATGLTYMQQRYYDPQVGQFRSVDPITVQGGDLRHFNRYAYAYNNPQKFTDPDGRCPICPVIIIVARELAAEGVEQATGVPMPTVRRIGTRAAREVGEQVAKRQAARGAADGAAAGKAATKRETGSYTNSHQSGKTYDGKGGRDRSQASGRRVESETGDKHVATDWSPAKNNREAFKQESERLDSHGGARSESNYNRIESPGKKMREEDLSP
jgi:RHS repeat-associated protein